MIIYAPHPPDSDTLSRVIEEMRSSGAPVVRVVFVNSECFALDGTHTLPAALHLDLKPRLHILKETSELPADLGLVGALWTPTTIAEIIDYLRKDYPYEFDDELETFIL